MGNFEKLSVLVIVVIIVMILVVALYTWTDKPSDELATDDGAGGATTLEHGVENEVWPNPGGGTFLPEDDEETDVSLVDTFMGSSGLGDDSKVDDETDEVEDDVEGDDASTGEALAASDDPTVTDTWVYVIKKGDILGRIAQRELGSTSRVKDILALNPNLDPKRLQINQSIQMPPRGMGEARVIADAGGASSGSRPVPGQEYVIQNGDTYESIAKRAYGSLDRWPELYAKASGVVGNRMRNLPAGVKIMIPR